MIRSMYANAKTAKSVNAAVLTTGAVTGSAVTWGDCKAAMAIIVAGTITDGTHTVEIQHSDDNSSWSAVPDAQLAGTEPALTSSNDDSVTDIGYKGVKPYLRAVVTTAAATTGGVVGVYFLKAYPSQGPLR